MRILLGTLILSIMLSLSINAVAEIKVYESTDNTGLNKQERIESVESFLITLSKSLKTMESKLDENAKKLGTLDTLVKAMKAQKEAEDKLVQMKLGEKKAAPSSEASGGSSPGDQDLSEVEKLKADLLVIKNKDIERLKMNFEELSDTVRALQATFKDQLEAAAAAEASEAKKAKSQKK